MSRELRKGCNLQATGFEGLECPPLDISRIEKVYYQPFVATLTIPLET
jgi:hypothetical protein